MADLLAEYGLTLAGGRARVERALELILTVERRSFELPDDVRPLRFVCDVQG